MINDKVVDFGYLSINHVGEELCGDNVAISNVMTIIEFLFWLMV